MLITITIKAESIHDTYATTYPSHPLTVTCNRAYFCPVCATIWATLDFGAVEWRPVSRGCVEHKHYVSEPNGSLFENWREDIFILPPKALFREMMRSLLTTSLGEQT